MPSKLKQLILRFKRLPSQARPTRRWRKKQLELNALSLGITISEFKRMDMEG